MRSFLMHKGFKRYSLLGIMAMGLFFLIVSPVMAAKTAPAGPTVPSALSPGEIAALTPAQKLARSNALTNAAFFMATKGLKTGDIALLREAQDLINQASALDCDVSRHSAGAHNAKLAQKALNISAQIVKAYNLILAALENMASSSTSPKVVAAIKAFQVKTTNARKDILTCQKIALNAGASMGAVEAYEPPAPTLKGPGISMVRWEKGHEPASAR